MLFGRKYIPISQQMLNVTICGTNIDRVESTKFLGLIIDEKLTWSKHVEHVSINVSKSLGVINRIRTFMPQSVLLTLYYTLVYPYLCYCNVIWGCAKPTILRKVLTLQKRAVRLITHSGYRAPSSPLFSRLQLLRLPEIYKSHISMFMFKFIKNMLPASCNAYFQVNSNIKYCTRKVNYLCLPSCRTTIRENCVTVSGPKIFNSLPSHLHECPSVTDFKRKLFEYLVSSYSQPESG